MLGHVLYEELSGNQNLDVYGTARNGNLKHWFSDILLEDIFTEVDAVNPDSVAKVIYTCKPDVVINCIGVIKQLETGSDPLTSIEINALLPHYIANYCASVGAKLIHFSTDCVFDGKKGNYNEADTPDATDLYGRTKILGEVLCHNNLTIRTSIIGHELKNKVSLIEWFLSQSDSVQGYKRAIFSGLPTIELVEAIKCIVFCEKDLQGLYHLSSHPISKYELLKLVAAQYKNTIEIRSDDSVILDRSLDSSKFRKATGYQPPAWPELVIKMHRHYITRGYGC